MRFAFTDDQRLLASTVAEVLAKHEGSAFAALAELGVCGMLAPEDDGGLGLTFRDLVLVLEEVGRAATPDPIVEHAAVAIPALGDSPWLARAAAGEVLVTVAAPYAPEADRAALVLAVRGEDLIAVEEPALTTQRSVDPGRRLFAVEGEGARVSDAATAMQRGALGSAAVCLGLGRAMIDMAAEYARERTQFGKPVGSFQLVKGLLADAMTALSFARPVVYRAADSVARDAPERALHVSMAKAAASEAAMGAARAALQVHGAIGYTEEHELHRWLKRTWTMAGAWGTAREHRDRIRDAVL